MRTIGMILLFRPCRIMAAALLCILCAGAFAQPPRPNYTADMPSVDRVKAEIKGSDPTDTLARQFAVFTHLSTYIQRIKYNRTIDGPYTPEEVRVMGAYDLAKYQISQDYAKSHTPAEIEAFGHLEGHYEFDTAFKNDWNKRLMGPQSKAAYQGMERDLGSRQAAHVESIKRANEEARKASAGASDDRSTDPTAVATRRTETGAQTAAPGSKAELRRCIASGRSMRICFTEVMGNAAEQLMGGSLKEPIPTGLRMTGDYASTTGFRLIFEAELATMVCRGVPESMPYAVQITENQALITIQHGSKPVVFSLGADGRLTGSGPIRVTGQVARGSHTEQTMGTTAQRTTTTREMTPLEARNYPNATRNGQTYTVQEDATEWVYGPAGSRTVTDFVIKSSDCALGPMSPLGASPLPHVPKNDLDVLTTIGAGLGKLMKGGNVNDATNEMFFPDAGKTLAPGLRMNGSYGSTTGFSVNFHPESVTAACGNAERALEYSVQRAGNKATLAIKDNANPISLQLMPDGSITGEGTVQVNGRVITGTTDDVNNPFVFAPHVSRCEVGRLVAGASAPTPPAAVSAVAPPPAPS